MKCLFCDKTDLTIEHIVPDNIGGSITIGICKGHNGFLNSKIDQKFTGLSVIQLAIFSLQITSRRDKTPHPFKSGEAFGEKILFDKDLKPYVVKKSSTIDASDEVRILDFCVDSADKDRIPQIIYRDLFQAHKEKYPEMQDSEINDRIEKLTKNLPNDLPTHSYNGPINTTISFCAKDFSLEFQKIAYEMACYNFGESYLEIGQVGNYLKNSILSLNANPIIKFQLIDVDFPWKTFFAALDKHYVVFFHDSCFISIFGFPGIIKVCGKKETFFLDRNDWIVYELCPVEKKNKKIKFEEFIKENAEQSHRRGK